MKIHIKPGILLCFITVITAVFSVNCFAGIGTPVMGSATASAEQAKKWAAEKNATENFISLADTFWEIAQAVGVNPVIAYCQSAKETAYGKFSGIVDESFFNPCGLKIANGIKDDMISHQRFNDWNEGIQAQIDHLALYAGAEGYPLILSPDPRHFTYIFGKCTTVEELGGSWAPSKTYGEEIVRMMADLEETSPAEQGMTAITALRNWSGRMRQLLNI